MTLLLEHTPSWLLGPIHTGWSVNWPNGVPMFGASRYWHAWLDISKRGLHYGFDDYRDAQNNAARGDCLALLALEALSVQLVIYRLSDARL